MSGEKCGLVVVNDIDIDRLAIAEPEDEAQFVADADAPAVGKSALERVQAIARNVEIGQDAVDPRDEMLR